MNPWLNLPSEGMKNDSPEPVKCHVIAKDPYPNYSRFPKLTKMQDSQSSIVSDANEPSR